MSESARQIAFDILMKIENDKAYSNLALDSAIKACCRDSTDCAFISRLVYGVVERKITLDYILSLYMSMPLSKAKTQVRTILRMGVYQIIFSQRIPDSAAVNESVKLAKDNGCSYASGLVNAVLRKISQNGFSLPDDMNEDERISVEFSAPVELVKFLVYHYGRENAKSFLRCALEPKHIFARINNTRISSDELKCLLESEGIGVVPTDIDNCTELVLNGAVYDSTAYKKGFFHIEDVSSQLCIKALEPYEGCTTIDVCAAPGGKSFTIAEYMNNKGVLYSCDIYESRTALIDQGAKRLGLSCIKTCVNDAAMFNDNFPLADRVLCDVPCSGMGIIAKKPEIKYKKLDDIKELIPIQKQILDVSSRYVKHGGRLVYSTCSVNPNENRKVCDAFLATHPDFFPCKALPDVERTVDEGDYLTLMLHKNKCDGFFIAVFERK